MVTRVQTVNSKPCSSWIPPTSPGCCLRFKVRISVYLKKGGFCLSAMGLEESRHSVDPRGKPLMMGFPEMVFFLLPFRPVWHSLSAMMKVSSSMPDPQEPCVYMNRVVSYNSYLKFFIVWWWFFFPFPQKLQQLVIWIKVQFKLCDRKLLVISLSYCDCELQGKACFNLSLHLQLKWRH